MSNLAEANEWFLGRGLPRVLSRRVRSRQLLERSAPAVGGLGALAAATILLTEVSDDRPDYAQASRLGLVCAAFAVAPFALYLLDRCNGRRVAQVRRTAALAVMAMFVFVMPVTTGGWSSEAITEAPAFVAVTLLTMWLTYLGLGAIAGWAFRFARAQFGALGALMSRALPLLMLTVVVFFTGELWQLAARMSRARLWAIVGFLAVVALLFMVATIRDELQALRDDRAERTDVATLLAGTPLSLDPGTSVPRTPLSRGERINVVAVMVVSQAIQVAFFTAGVFAFFLALGGIAIPDEVAVLWSSEEACQIGQPPCAATWFGVHLPIPQTMVHVALFVAVLSGLYFTVSTSTDPLYRERFFDPLIANVAVSLAGRDAYLHLGGRRRSSRRTHPTG